MCKIFCISRDTVLNFVSKKESFSFSDLENEILKKGGSMRVAPNYTVEDYLSDFQDNGVLKFNPDKDEYLVVCK